MLSSQICRLLFFFNCKPSDSRCQRCVTSWWRYVCVLPAHNSPPCLLRAMTAHDEGCRAQRWGKSLRGVAWKEGRFPWLEWQKEAWHEPTWMPRCKLASDHRRHIWGRQQPTIMLSVFYLTSEPPSSPTAVPMRSCKQDQRSQICDKLIQRIELELEKLPLHNRVRQCVVTRQRGATLLKEGETVLQRARNHAGLTHDLVLKSSRNYMAHKTLKLEKAWK